MTRTRMSGLGWSSYTVVSRDRGDDAETIGTLKVTFRDHEGTEYVRETSNVLGSNRVADERSHLIGLVLFNVEGSESVNITSRMGKPSIVTYTVSTDGPEDEAIAQELIDSGYATPRTTSTTTTTTTTGEETRTSFKTELQGMFGSSTRLGLLSDTRGTWVSEISLYLDIENVVDVDPVDIAPDVTMTRDVADAMLFSPAIGEQTKEWVTRVLRRSDGDPYTWVPVLVDDDDRPYPGAMLRYTVVGYLGDDTSKAKYLSHVPYVPGLLAIMDQNDDHDPDMPETWVTDPCDAITCPTMLSAIRVMEMTARHYERSPDFKDNHLNMEVIPAIL